VSLLSRLRGRSTPEVPADLPYPAVSDGGLAARWVRWAAASGLLNAIDDRTGEDAGHGQPDDVRFHLTIG